MPRKSTRSTNTSPSNDWKIKVENSNFVDKTKAFFHDNRTKVIAGIILIAVALFMLIAYISFFFTGAADASILDLSHTERVAHRAEITNFMGLVGAHIAAFLVDGSFGIFSMLIVAMLFLYGLQLLDAYKDASWKLFFCSVFYLLWGSILLGFIQQMTGITSFFRWGGVHGTFLADWLNSYIQPVGVSILLAVSLIVFLVCSDKQFIPHCQQAWAWLRDKLRRKPKADEPVDVVPPMGQEDEPSNEITIELENVTPPEPAAQDELKIEIVGQQAEETVAEEVIATQDEESASNEEQQAAELEINETEEVELSEDDPEYLLKTLGPYDPRKDLETYKFPSLNLLKVYDNETAPIIDPAEQQANANRIVQTLRNYDVEVDSIKATVGPTVTLYEIVPKAGTRIAKIQNLENDIMMSLSAIGIRIIAPMPGKGTVGIEVPNEKPQVVSMHSVIASKRFQEEQKMHLPIALGRTITNEVFCFDLAKTPHLLVAGATGQGKSVGLNAIITSLLYKKHPAELKLILVDPKMVEFSIYKPLIRHFMAAMPDQDPRDIIITDCQKVINTLNSLVIEMEDRYSLLAEANCRNLEDYNEKFAQRRLNPKKNVENVVTKKLLHHHYMPYIVMVIDEYGDFIMQAGKEVERPIQRLTQKARAVGMHLILATQRPDVKIVTGIIKANIPTRIAFRTQSVVDSRTVLDVKGADQLVGKGDLLYSAGGKLTRIQCAFVDTPEVETIVDHIQSQQGYTMPFQLPEYVPENGDDAAAPGSVDMKRLDPMFADVARYVVSKQEGSTSRLQRAFEIGYNRAGKLSDQLEAAGIVGPNKGSKGRDVLIQDMESLEVLLQQLGV